MRAASSTPSRAWPDGQLDLEDGAGIPGLHSRAGCRPTSSRSSSCRTPASTGVALQSGIWFVVTAIGIAAMDGTIVQWTRTQQVVGVGGGGRAVLAHLHDARGGGLNKQLRKDHGFKTHRNARLPGFEGAGVLFRGAPADRLPDEQARLSDQGRHPGDASGRRHQARRQRPAAAAEAG